MMYERNKQKLKFRSSPIQIFDRAGLVPEAMHEPKLHGTKYSMYGHKWSKFVRYGNML